MSTGKKFTAGLVAGMLVGVAAGLLLAPKKGTETRELLSVRTNALRDRIDKIRRCNQAEDASNRHAEVSS